MSARTAHGRAPRVAAAAAALVAVLVLVLAPARAHAAVNPKLPALTGAMLVEPVTGTVLYQRSAHSRRLIASTTKLMTALVTLERVSLDTVFTAPIYHAEPAESLMGLHGGERIRVRDLLAGLLLPSGNDAAHALAVGVAGSQARFVALMNERARALGLRDTHYSNPIGLDAGDNRSSAADLVTLATALERYPFFRRTVGARRVRLTSGRGRRVLVNHNRLVGRWAPADGIKTGHTNAAGYVLVGSASRGGVRVISAVLGTASMDARDGASLALLEAGLRACRLRTVVSPRRTVARPRVKDRGDLTAALVAARTVRLPSCDGHPLRTVVTAPAQLDGPLAAGTRAGTMTVRANGRVLARVPLVTAAAVPDAPLYKRVLEFLVKPGTLAGVGALLVLLGFGAGAVRRRGRQRREAPA